MRQTFLYLADGFEEMEAIVTVDVLRRGGVDVRTVSIGEDSLVRGAHGVTVVADRRFAEVESEDAECLVFPGGMPGAQTLADCGPLVRRLQRQYDGGGFIAAICAAPALVFSKLDTGRRVRVTCYPGFEGFLSPDFDVVTDGVVADGTVITGKGPGFAVPFGLMILERLRSVGAAADVSAGLLL